MKRRAKVAIAHTWELLWPILLGLSLGALLWATWMAWPLLF